MSKSDIAWTGGLFLIGFGATVIHLGFGLIVFGAFLAGWGAVQPEQEKP